MTFALLPAVFINVKASKHCQGSVFPYGKALSRSFFFPLVKIFFLLEEGNETFKTSRYYTFKAPLMSCLSYSYNMKSIVLVWFFLCFFFFLRIFLYVICEGFVWYPTEMFHVAD